MDKKKNLLITLQDSRRQRPAIRLYEQEWNAVVELARDLLNYVKEELMPDYQFEEFRPTGEEAMEAIAAEVQEDVTDLSTDEHIVDAPESPASDDDKGMPPVQESPLG